MPGGHTHPHKGARPRRLPSGKQKVFSIFDPILLEDRGYYSSEQLEIILVNHSTFKSPRGLFKVPLGAGQASGNALSFPSLTGITRFLPPLLHFKRS